MSIKAGRVGVNPADVDPINGHISPESLSGYTKQEADAKFETQTHAASTYETKTEAGSAHALLQPKTLAVPIHMLDGSKLTVEAVLDGVSGSDTSVTVVEGLTVVEDINHVRKFGSLVEVCLKLSGVTLANGDKIGDIPLAYIPKDVNLVYDVRHSGGTIGINIDATGKMTLNGGAVSNTTLQIHLLYMSY